MGKEDKMQNVKAAGKEEKLIALEAALSQIEKQYGKGSVMKLGDKGANTKKAWDERIAHPTHGKC